MIEVRYLSAPEFPCVQVIIAAGSEALVLRPSEALDLLASLERDREPLQAALAGEQNGRNEIIPFADLAALLEGGK